MRNEVNNNLSISEIRELVANDDFSKAVKSFIALTSSDNLELSNELILLHSDFIAIQREIRHGRIAVINEHKNRLNYAILELLCKFEKEVQIVKKNIKNSKYETEIENTINDIDIELSNTVRIRIWNELYTSRFYFDYLSIFLGRKNLIHKVYNLNIVISSIIILACAYFSLLSYLICILLLLVAVLLTLFKDLILTLKKELITLKSVYNFYRIQHKKLERLWYEYNTNNMSYIQLLNKFNQLLEEEALISEIHEHEQLFKEDDIFNQATIISNQYINSLNF